MTMLKKIASTGYGVQAVLRFALSAVAAEMLLTVRFCAVRVPGGL